MVDEKQAVASFEESLRELTPRIYATPALVAINAVVFVVMVVAGVDALSPNGLELLDWGANYGPWTTEGEWWRLLTCTFVHAGILHVAFNMFVLADVGRRVERMVGSRGFLVMYLVSGVLGSLASIAVHPAVTSVGASGAVFGVLGCLLGLLVLQRGTIPQGALNPIARDAAVFVGYNVVFGLNREGIDMAAHFGGLAAGFLCGMSLAHPLRREAISRRTGRALRTLALGAVAIGIGVAVVPRTGAGFQGELKHFADIEEKVLDTMADVVGKAQRGEMTDAEVSAVVRRDVLPPWREATDRWEALDVGNLSAEEKSAHGKLLRYAKLRGEAFQLFVEGIDEQDPAKIEAANQKAAEAAELAK